MGMDKTLDLLEAADWKDIVFGLTRYAYWKASMYTWKSKNRNHLPGGNTPEDIALGAIEKVWSGVRDWNSDKYPNLLKHSMKIVDSDLNHLFKSMEHWKSERIPDKSDDLGIKGALDESHAQISATIHQVSIAKNPEEQLIAVEDKEYEDKVKNEFYAMVKGDEDLEMLLLCFEEGIDKPEAIAAQTGWDIQMVYNLKRKLSRSAAKLNKIILQVKQEERRNNGER